jgi:hypothetical protein
VTTLVSSIINAFSLRPRLLFLPSAVLLFVLSSRSTVFADSATWKQNPASGNWNTAVNWTPEIVPYLPGTATFGVSSITNIGRSNVNTLLDGIVFGPGASAFTITGTDLDSLAFYFGAGITNNSGIAQNFVVSGAVGANRYSGIWFNNSTAAGNLTFFTINGSANSPGLGGFIQFYDTASAANGTFTNKGGEATGAYGGSTEFHANSTAGNSTFFINGGVVRGR